MRARSSSSAWRPVTPARGPRGTRDARVFDVAEERAPLDAQAGERIAHLASAGARDDAERLDAALGPRELADDAAEQGRAHAGAADFRVLEEGEAAVA